jgi:RNA polymerase sigma-70 factor (family 1)
MLILKIIRNDGRVNIISFGIHCEIGQILINVMIDKNGFKALFDEYYESIRLYIYYKIAEKNAADDMAQDVFMVIWEKRGSIQLLSIKTLLYKIASGMVIDYYRKNNVRADFSKWVRWNKEENETVTPHEQAEYTEAMALYAQALNKMSEGQREVFMMNREEQLTYKEIALRLDLSVKAVEKRMSGALKIINENMLTL